jgi:hypothetical protein
MNAPTQRAESGALAIHEPQSYEVGQVNDAAALILGPAFDRVQSFAKLMSTGSVSVPKHLRGNMGDCMAITIQALGWRMNPFAVAQKTHMSQSGALGYEAQLVSAILVSTGAIKREPEYEAIGDWSKVLGKVEERQGKARPDGTEGGKWFAATYTKKDEEGLGVIVRATLSGESSPRELRVMMSQAYPRFSTQWATDPFQQLCYLAVRKWGRLNSPGAILGVYTPEELEGGPPMERHMGPADVVQPAGPAAAAASGDTKTGAQQPADSDADFEKRLPIYQGYLVAGKSHDDIVAFVKSKRHLTADQETKIRALKKPGADAQAAAGQQVTDVQPKDQGAPQVTYAQVADRIAKAATTEQLDEAETLIPAILDGEQRNELFGKAEARRAELTKGA